MTKSLKTVGEEAWKRVEKVNGELFVLTYGAIVSQLCRDCGAAGLPSVNDELYKMGYNIGCRLIEDFLAKASWPRCRSFAESVTVLSSVAFKMSLNCAPGLVTVAEDQEYQLCFRDGDESAMPLLEFVRLPDTFKGQLKYLNVLPGIIKGAFEMIHLNVDCWLIEEKDDDSCVKIGIKFNRLIEESLPPGE